MRTFFSTSLTRKVIALMVLVIVSGATPATSILGFCARMPCCVEEAKSGPALIADADCCNTISCFEAPPPDLTVAAKAAVLPPASLVALRVTLPAPQVVSARRTFDDTSPPSTMSDRLSTLSLFLI